MIAILSPAKSLDFDTPAAFDFHTSPPFGDETAYLAKKLGKMSQKKIGDLMHLSDNLAALNYNRYKNWNFDDDEGKKQAMYAFTGDVYRGFDIAQLNQQDMEYAQEHIRILSGIYGILRPMDFIQPYRLEMGTKWEITKKNKNLYAYWGNKISKRLNEEMQEPNILVNLASNEYFKAVDKAAFDGRIINITFKENKEGKYKIVAIFAKLARGAFARFMVQNRVQDVESLKLFKEDGYAFHDSLSSENELVFTR